MYKFLFLLLLLILLKIPLIGFAMENKHNFEFLYKVVTIHDWTKMQKLSEYKGNESEQSEKFIHLSTKKQVERIINKMCKDKEQVVLLKIHYLSIKDKVKWEENKGELYPHLYGVIRSENIRESISLKCPQIKMKY